MTCRSPTPGDWIVFDLRDADGAPVERLVADRLDDLEGLAPHRDQLVGFVARTWQRARREGVLLAAILVDQAERGAPVIANLALARAPAPPRAPREAAGPPGGSGLAAVDDTLARQATERRVTERVVTSVLLPGGPALRVARLLDLPLAPDGPSVAVLSVQYVFTASDLDEAFVLAFSSPSIAAHEELQALFHAIASTLRIGQAA